MYFIAIFLNVFVLFGGTFGQERNIVDVYSKVANGALISELCRKQMGFFMDNLFNNSDGNEWALKMVDSSTKIQNGLLTFNFGEMGNFDECIKVEASVEDLSIYGKYCLGYISFNASQGIFTSIQKQRTLRKNLGGVSLSSDNSGGIPKYVPTVALCIPNACTIDEINLYLHQEVVTEDSELNIVFPSMYCQTKDDVYPKLSTAAILTISFFLFICVIMLMSTAFEIYAIQTGKEIKLPILIAFSLFTNCKKLFNMTPPKDNMLPCLNGIRFISMMWVIAGHSVSVTMNGPVYNNLDVLNWANNLRSMLFVSGGLSVDTFFVVGSALLVYGFFRSKHSKVKFNIPMFYLHRYIRLTPAVAAAVLVSATLLKYLGSGPYWWIIDFSFQKNCEENWWTALLYIQNYVNVEKMCLGQSWYLDIDMQLYWLSPIFLIILWRKPKIGLLFQSLCVVVFTAVPFYIAWKYDLNAILSNLYSTNQSTDFMNEYYLLTHARAGPWFIGTILGFLISQIQYGKIHLKLNKIIQIGLWIICLSVMLTCVFGGHSTLRGPDYDKWGNILHITFVRPAWAICICVVILLCITQGGPINWFLSLPIFGVLNRFSYSMYLTHVTTLYMITYSTKLPVYFSDFYLIYNYWSIFMFTIGISLFWVLAFESPMIAIEKVIFG